MANIAIHAEGLSKRYHLASGPRYKALRDVLTEAARSPLKAIRRRSNAGESVLWALNNVSFEIRRGDAVGIIGRNGAGKSTLLKLLSRVTEPTSGHARFHGRLGTLLEVGTGFHPELTGRENIFLNAAILGMRRQEILRKFDGIVDFAEIEKFLDTPVKRYSSGMYVRLAFAVAAHLEPEILIVDEVLAVGDVQFQKKCLGKMEDVSKNEGRTVLCVSHQMGTIANLCKKAVLLKKGKLVESGLTNDVINNYLGAGTDSGNIKYSNNDGTDKEVFISEVGTVNKNGEFVNEYGFNENIT